MKNKEKFAKEIVELACNGDSIAIIKENGRIVSCDGTKCSLCLFRDYDCKEKTREWAESEYIEKPVISKRDRAFLDYLNCNYKYIARDMSGDLCVYLSKPHRMIDYWESAGEIINMLRMFNIDFPMIKWSDKEPWHIEDLKKLEVVEKYD